MQLNRLIREGSSILCDDIFFGCITLREELSTDSMKVQEVRVKFKNNTKSISFRFSLINDYELSPHYVYYVKNVCFNSLLDSLFNLVYKQTR